MTTNTFDTEESNSNINSPQYFVDDDGSLKFISPVLSSSNFDGSVPVFEGQITASAISPGKFIKTGGEYFPVISVAYDDQELEESPSNEIAVTYLDSNSEVQEIIYNLTDDVDVKYENWEEKYLGTQGWSLTYGGNAIFTNVAVRGRIEADEGYISGNLTIGSGGSTTLDEVATADDLTDFITGPEVNTNVTSISGGVITSGRIKSGGYNGPDSGGGSFSTIGSQFNLDDGSIVTPSFRVTSTGSAEFRGSIQSSAIRSSDFSTGIDSTGRSIDIYKFNFFGGGGTVLSFSGPTSAGTIPSTIQRDAFGRLYIGPEVSGNHITAIGGRLVVSSSVQGLSFYGDGSGLTNLPGGTYILNTGADPGASNYPAGTVWYVY